MKEGTVKFLYSLVVSLAILQLAFNSWWKAIKDDYPFYRSVNVYGMDANHRNQIGPSYSCDGVADCAKVSCKIFNYNDSVAHVVVDPINDYRLPKPNCDLNDTSDWYQRMLVGDEQLLPMFYMLLAAAIAAGLRALIGTLYICVNHNVIQCAYICVFCLEKLFLLGPIYLMLTLSPQSPWLAWLMYVLDVVILFTRSPGKAK